MSRRRYLSTRISTDVAVNKLAAQAGDFAALLYTWMIPHAADDGSLPYDPEELMLTVIPGRRDKDVEDVKLALTNMEALRLVIADHSARRLSFPPAWWRKSQYALVSPERLAWQRVRTRTRLLVFQRDGHLCRRCGSGRFPEVDHVIPLAKGGSNDPSNLQVLCRSCNRRKWAH